MSVEERPFAPFYNRSQYVNGAIVQTGTLVPSVTVVGAATATASTVFPGVANNSIVQIQIANTTNQWAFVNFGVLNSAQAVRVATVTDYPVAPGGTAVVTVDPEVNAASVILAAAPGASTAVVFTRGAGT